LDRWARRIPTQLVVEEVEGDATPPNGALAILSAEHLDGTPASPIETFLP
jgi:hypothetical protein